MPLLAMFFDRSNFLEQLFLPPSPEAAEEVWLDLVQWF